MHMRFEKISTKPALAPEPAPAQVQPPARLACKDCKWFGSGGFHGCSRPELLAWHPIHGYGDSHAKLNREAASLCGPDGKFWEQRAPPIKSRWLRNFLWLFFFLDALAIWWTIAHRN